MTNRNLIVLIIGIVILIILVGGGFYIYQNKKQNVAVTPAPTTPTPGPTTPPAQLSTDQLKANCLANKDNIKQFLLAAQNNDNIGNLLDEINATAVITNKATSNQKPTFEQDKRIVFECYNTDPQKFKDCQNKLGGFQINNIDLEGTVMGKLKDFYNSVSDYLTCKAVESKNPGICSKFFLSANFVSDCQSITKWYDVMTSVYSQPNCEALCKSDANSGDFQTETDLCLSFCLAVKNSDLNKCKNLADNNKELACEAFIALDSSYCQKIKPQVIKIKQADGTTVESDQVADCQLDTLISKALKQNDPTVLNQAKSANSVTNNDMLFFLKNLYFGKTGCEGNFDTLYNNYCNLKYSQ